MLKYQTEQFQSFMGGIKDERFLSNYFQQRILGVYLSINIEETTAILIKELEDTGIFTIQYINTIKNALTSVILHRKNKEK